MNRPDNDIIRELIRCRGYDPLIIIEGMELSSIEELEESFGEDLLAIPADLEDPSDLLYLSFVMHLYPEYRDDIMYSALKSNEREQEDISEAISELFDTIHQPATEMTRAEFENLTESDRRIHLERFIRSQFDQDAFLEEIRSSTYEYSLEPDLLDAIADRVSHYLTDDSEFAHWAYPKVRAYLMTNVRKLEDHLRKDLGYSLSERREIIKHLMLTEDEYESEYVSE